MRLPNDRGRPLANSKPEFHYQAKSGVVGDLDQLPDQLWQLAANLRLIDRGFSADAECPCGCLPHDPVETRRAAREGAGCNCWDGLDVNTAAVINQRLEMMENRQRELAEAQAGRDKRLLAAIRALDDAVAHLDANVSAVGYQVSNGART